MVSFSPAVGVNCTVGAVEAAGGAEGEAWSTDWAGADWFWGAVSWGNRRKKEIPAKKHQQGQGNSEDYALIAIH